MEKGGSSNGNGEGDRGLRERVMGHRSEYPLPIANLVRLMRQVLPEGVKVSGTTKVLVHNCTLEFAGFLSNEAADHCRLTHRRTLAPEDVVWSLDSLGFERYAQAVATYLRRYREDAGGASSSSAMSQPITVEEMQMLAQMLGVQYNGGHGEAGPSA